MMKKLIILLFIAISAQAQSEFTEFENNLIYSPEAISKLQEIVGDKNEEFRKCDLTKNFVSIPQTKGICLIVKEHNRKGLIKDLKANISLEEFKTKYKPELETQLSLVTKSQYINYADEEIIEIREQPDGNYIIIDVKDWEKSNYGNWIVSEYDKDMKLFFIQDEFKTIKLPYEYSRMIQYTECLIDTTTQIHPANSKYSEREFRFANDTQEIGEKEVFYKYIKDQFSLKEPKLDKKTAKLDYEEKFASEKYKKYEGDHEQWDKSRLVFIKDTLSKKAKFIDLLTQAYQAAIKEKSSNDEFEMYVSAYLSKEKGLTLKRNRIVMGTCSMDRRPRIHAMNIAQLSAESYQWDIFLRAHLNIMNDRFQRASDGSYAWKQRNTYIKELEVLNIDVPSLVYGISLRVDNPSKNHYFGSIRRLGRAVAESNDKEKMVSQLVAMIKDKSLDDYNRLLTFYLYQNLQYNLSEDFDKEQLQPIVALLPAYIASKI